MAAWGGYIRRPLSDNELPPGPPGAVTRRGYAAAMATEDASAPPPLAIVDIDGVVADVRHRLHHLERRPRDWDAFFDAADDDPVHDEGVAIVARLAEDHEIVFLTGRPHRLERATRAWLEDHGLGGHRLVMRPNGDRRSAVIVKAELLARVGHDRTVAVVVDDDPAIVEAMRAAGYPTFHADWERRPANAQRELDAAQERLGRT